MLYDVFILGNEICVDRLMKLVVEFITGKLCKRSIQFRKILFE